MKFFYLKKKQTTDSTSLFRQVNTKSKNNFLKHEYLPTQIQLFSNFFSPKGSLIKNKLLVSKVINKINYSLYYNNAFLINTYPNIKWIIDDIIQKKTNFSYIFSITSNLIKPPFVVKSILVPKKLRKKTKQKYLIKIVYKNENKRLKNAYKQLYYYSNKFNDSNFDVRLYKSILFSFLDWKNSYLFKLKSMVFKKFFKF